MRDGTGGEEERERDWGGRDSHLATTSGTSIYLYIHV